MKTEDIYNHNYFWISPWDSRKYHIAGKDGRSLCGHWLMTDQTSPLLKAPVVNDSEDCKACSKAFKKLMEK